MACEYCKNKFKIKPLVEPKDKDEGIVVWVKKRDEGAYLCVYGWFEYDVIIGEQQAKINYCPMCGERLVEE